MNIQKLDDITNMVPEHLRDLVPYDPAFTPCEINLSANENNYPMPEAAATAIQQALAEVDIKRYPQPLDARLRDELAAWHGVPRECIIVGNGGDELIFNFLLAFGQGKTLLNFPPTFSVYELYGSMIGVSCHNVWRDAQTMLPPASELEAAAQADCDLAILTSPNNPTGDTAPRELVKSLLKHIAGPVLIDEAYGEFACEGDIFTTGSSFTSSVLPMLEEYPNLVVLHTLSKAFGMAGARIGYMIANPALIDMLVAVRQPYSVNSYSAAAATAAIQHRALFEPIIKRIIEQRQALEKRFAALPGVTVWPSSANFLLVRVPNAAKIRARLRDEFSILVRDLSNSPGLDGCLRITVGTEEENEAVMAAFTQLLEA